MRGGTLSSSARGFSVCIVYIGIMFSHLAYEFAELVFFAGSIAGALRLSPLFSAGFRLGPGVSPPRAATPFRESRLRSRAGFSVCGARAWYLARCPVPPAVLACGRAVLHCRPWSCQAGVGKAGQRGYWQATAVGRALCSAEPRPKAAVFF